MKKRLTKMVLLTFVLSTILSVPALAEDTVENTSEIKLNSGYDLPTEADKQKNADFRADMDALRDAYYQYFNDEITIEELQQIEIELMNLESVQTRSNGLTTLAEGTKHREAIERYKSELKANTRTNAIITPYNIGDYEYENAPLAAEYQQEDYYCGPATAVSIVNGKGSYVSQVTAASLLGTTWNGTNFGNNWLKVLNASYTGHNYQVAWGYYGWPADLANRAITSTKNTCGFALNAYMYDTNTYLPGYNYTMGEVYHYVAGCGYDSTDPSRRYIRYFDPNGNVSGAAGYHKVTVQLMGRATEQRGVVHAY